MRAADRAAQPVRADDEVGPGLTAAVPDDEAVAVVADGGHLAARPQALRGQCLGERPQQLGAVHDEQRMAEAAHEFRVVRTGQPAAPAVAYTARGLDGADRPHGVGQTERVERAQGVRPEGDPGADLGELGRPFQHFDAPAPPVQGDGGREAADPAADDGGGALRHGSSLRFWGSAGHGGGWGYRRRSG